jgi:hypothetical protein
MNVDVLDQNASRQPKLAGGVPSPGRAHMTNRGGDNVHTHSVDVRPFSGWQWIDSLE